VVREARQRTQPGSIEHVVQLEIEVAARYQHAQF
jgi:hypothetical protein